MHYFTFGQFSSPKLKFKRTILFIFPTLCYLDGVQSAWLRRDKDISLKKIKVGLARQETRKIHDMPHPPLYALLSLQGEIYLIISWARFSLASVLVVFQLSLEVIATIMASLWLTFLLIGGFVARARSHTYKAHISLLRSTDGKLPQIRSIWRDASQGQTGTPWDRALTWLFRFYHATKN